MKTLPNLSEAEIVDSIYRVVNQLASRFRFGYHSIEDMKQEGAKFAIEAINSGSYDASRPLENFLYTHLRNRFINFKRDKYIRNEPPCKTCIFYDPTFKKSTNACGAFVDKGDCQKLTDWQVRNSVKKSLMRPLDVSLVSDDSIETADNNSMDMDFDELKDKINIGLPADLRTDYLRLLAGQNLPKLRKQRVREAVMEILNVKSED